MPDIAIRSVSKRFGAVTALTETDLVVPDGAFLALLGPSGCGKTTLLRLIAGFEAPTTGSIAFGDRVVAGPGRMVPPEERAVGMVFQSYALWPHLTVAENIVYPLRVARRPVDEIARRLAATLERVGLAGFEGRMPDALSGGQRQRVALARALIQEAGVILFDEPLANLDAHLRAAMADRFADLHRDSGRTFVYVTHDQAEALTLATHLAVMAEGRIVQFGAPEAVYRSPRSRAVAGFLGRGAVVTARLAGDPIDGRVPIALGGVSLLARADARTVGTAARDGAVPVLIRPEAVTRDGPLVLTVTRARYRGASSEVTAATTDGQALVLDWPERVAAGDRIACAVADAWLLPEP